MFSTWKKGTLKRIAGIVHLNDCCYWGTTSLSYRTRKQVDTLCGSFVLKVKFLSCCQVQLHLSKAAKFQEILSQLFSDFD